jgi:prepilin-type N-terminal cleavage/methylation domain-containing protein
VNCPTPHRRRPRRGFTLVEVLIAVSLTAALAVASAAALAAASRSAEAGDEYLRASRTAARVLETITADVRGASAVQVLSATSLQVVREDSSIVVYRYDAAPRELHITHNDGLNVRDNVLARQISGVAFAGVVEPDPSTLVNRVVQVTVTMQVTDANTATTAMTASANCRRKRSYR